MAAVIVAPCTTASSTCTIRLPSPSPRLPLSDTCSTVRHVERREKQREKQTGSKAVDSGQRRSLRIGRIRCVRSPAVHRGKPGYPLAENYGSEGWVSTPSERADQICRSNRREAFDPVTPRSPAKLHGTRRNGAERRLWSGSRRPRPNPLCVKGAACCRSDSTTPAPRPRSTRPSPNGAGASRSHVRSHLSLLRSRVGLSNLKLHPEQRTEPQRGGSNPPNSSTWDHLDRVDRGLNYAMSERLSATIKAASTTDRSEIWSHRS